MHCPCHSRNSLTVCAFCGGSPNLAKLDKCRPMIVKQSRIQKMLRWLINESKDSAHSAVSFDGDCTARSTHWFRPGCAQPDLSSFYGGFSFHFDFGFRLGCSPIIGSTIRGWRLSRALLFEHVHVPPPPTDEPIHSWLLFKKALRYLNQDKPTYVIPTGDAPLWEPSDELMLSKLWPLHTSIPKRKRLESQQHCSKSTRMLRLK
ncbi:BQ5605_C021g09327 [Microbotryum silenes-dioicae]|uniref:BQ5605_C021g09327 protein n=1 Tax=Microbotryum silenes-dioicae TaxID=796604 RepID=A0A2X0MNJ8_9BASI|nr:BQ5605_C021g09327 [Microbotryum silenes-dioicae]